MIQEFGANTLDAKALFHQLKKTYLAAKSDRHWTFTSPAMMIRITLLVMAIVVVILRWQNKKQKKIMEEEQ